MDLSSRDQFGGYAEGNPGGPGRPRRVVERKMLDRIGDSVPLDVWQEIVAATVVRAREGDAQARSWLSRYLLDGKGLSLLERASEMSGGHSVTEEFIHRLSHRYDKPDQPGLDLDAERDSEPEPEETEDEDEE